MINNSFSCSYEYGSEIIPQLGFFEKKQWIKRKIAKLADEKFIFFLQKDRILWVYLEDEQSYWLPYEKSLLYYHAFSCKAKCILIIEKSDEENNYYGLLNGDLISFSKEYDVVKLELSNLCNENDKIRTLGVGDIDDKCDIKISFEQLREKLQLKDSVIDDDLLYLNEEHEGYGKKVDNSLNEIFYKWFENNCVKNNYWKKILIRSALFGFLFFSTLSYYLNNQTLYMHNQTAALSSNLEEF